MANKHKLSRWQGEQPVDQDERSEQHAKNLGAALKISYYLHNADIIYLFDSNL